jgi:predicted Zn-dependent peptidase
MMSNALSRTITDAGTEILIQPLPHVRSCSIGFWVKRGSCHEGPNEEGLAHFIEHTVFKGTQRYPDPEVMAAATDRLGGNVDAFTGKENACFYGKVLRDQLPNLVDLLGELVTAPIFEPQELVRERSVILEEIAQSEDQPDDWVSELFYENFWPGSPLAHSILGRREQVSSYGSDEARTFFRKTYRAPNLLIAAAGDIEVKPMLAMLQPILDRLPDGEPGPQAESRPPAPFLLNQSRKDLQQANLVLGFPICGHRHPDRAGVNLLSHVLGGGMSSRLFMELREKNALCYQVGSYVSHYRETGALQIIASCAPDKARELVRRSMVECRHITEEGITAEELDRAKLQARTNLVFSQESTSARMFTLAHQAIHMGRIQNLDEQIAEIDAVDLEQLVRIAREVLQPERLAVSALGTRRGSEIRKQDLSL